MGHGPGRGSGRGLTLSLSDVSGHRIGSRQISPHHGREETRFLLLLRASYWWLLRLTRLGNSTWANFLSPKGQLPPNLTPRDLAGNTARLGRNFSKWPSVSLRTHIMKKDWVCYIKIIKASRFCHLKPLKPLEFLLNRITTQTVLFEAKSQTLKLTPVHFLLFPLGAYSVDF